MTEHYLLIFDGGSIGNPGQAYGSIRIGQPSGRLEVPERFDFGTGTNNEAEYRALIEGFKVLLSKLEEDEIEPDEVAVEVRGDSNLVINQLAGNWKIKSPAMRKLHDEAAALAMRFEHVEYLHQDRAATIRALGH